MTIIHSAMNQYAEGVSNNSVAGPLLPFTTPGQQGWKVVYEPFERGYALADGAKWESLVEGVGTVTYGVNGTLLTTAGTNNSSGYIGWTTPNLMIGAATKKFYLETSFTLTAATMASNEMFIGFADLAAGDALTDLVGGTGIAWAFADGFGFGKLDFATELDFISIDGGTEQDVALTVTPTTSVLMKLGCYYDGANFLIYVNDVLNSTTAQTSLNVDTAMSLCAYCKAGTGEVQTLTTNYILLATEI